MQDKDQRLSALSVALGIGSLILCFSLGYLGPLLGAGAAAAGFLLARRVGSRAPGKLTQWGKGLGVAGLVVNAVSLLAILLMLLLGAALMGSPGSFF